MRKLPVLTLLLIFSTSAFAGDKQKGTTTLKDVQPAGTTEKNHKHQQYDLSFVTTTGKDYELLLFPEARHMPRNPVHLEYLERKLIEFLNRYLKA